MAYGSGTNAPQGFKPSSYLGGTWSGQLSNYSILSTYATAIYSGDPTITLASGGIGIGVAGSGVLGIFQGVKWTDSTGNAQFAPYWTASTVTFGSEPATALIVDDLKVEFDIQCGTSNSGTHTASVVQTDINRNANFVIAAGSTVTGQTGTYLDLATLDTTATLNAKLLRLTPVPGNDFGVLYNNVTVLLNNAQLAGGTGTAGT